MLPTAHATATHTVDALGHTHLEYQQQQHQDQHAQGAGTATQRRQWEARLASFQRGLDHVMRCSAGDACGSSLCHATRRLMRTYATHDCTNPPGSSKNSPTTTAPECKVCKLWGYLLSKNKASARGPHGGGVGGRGSAPQPIDSRVISLSPLLSASSPPPSPSLPPLSCGLADARARRMHHGHSHPPRPVGLLSLANASAAASQRRVVVTQELIKAMSKRV